MTKLTTWMGARGRSPRPASAPGDPAASARAAQERLLAAMGERGILDDVPGLAATVSEPRLAAEYARRGPAVALLVQAELGDGPRHRALPLMTPDERDAAGLEDPAGRAAWAAAMQDLVAAGWVVGELLAISRGEGTGFVERPLDDTLARWLPMIRAAVPSRDDQFARVLVTWAAGAPARRMPTPEPRPGRIGGGLAPAARLYVAAGTALHVSQRAPVWRGGRQTVSWDPAGLRAGG